MSQYPVVTHAIILAGGLGSRLSQVVPNLPKPMASIQSKPFLAHLLDYLEAQGIREVFLSVGFRHDEIINYFGGRHGALRLRYVIEDEPLGTGGAIQRSLRAVTADPVFILNGDTFAQIDYADMARTHRAAGVSITIALRHVTQASRYGTVVVEDGRIREFLEKHRAGPGLINTGVYLLARSILLSNALPPRFSFETDFLYPNAGSLRPLAYVSDGYFIDIGIPEDYFRAQREMVGFVKAAAGLSGPVRT